MAGHAQERSCRVCDDSWVRDTSSGQPTNPGVRLPGFDSDNVSTNASSGHG